MPRRQSKPPCKVRRRHAELQQPFSSAHTFSHEACHTEAKETAQEILRAKQEAWEQQQAALQATLAMHRDELQALRRASEAATERERELATKLQAAERARTDADTAARDALERARAELAQEQMLRISNMVKRHEAAIKEATAAGEARAEEAAKAAIAAARDEGHNNGYNEAATKHREALREADAAREAAERDAADLHRRQAEEHQRREESLAAQLDEARENARRMQEQLTQVVVNRDRAIADAKQAATGDMVSPQRPSECTKPASPLSDSASVPLQESKLQEAQHAAEARLAAAADEHAAEVSRIQQVHAAEAAAAEAAHEAALASARVDASKSQDVAFTKLREQLQTLSHTQVNCVMSMGVLHPRCLCDVTLVLLLVLARRSCPRSWRTPWSRSDSCRLTCMPSVPRLKCSCPQ